MEFNLIVLVVAVVFILCELDGSLSQEISYETTQENLIVAQCQSQCLFTEGNLFLRKTRDGVTYKQYRCGAACQPCWYGCETRTQSMDLCFKDCDLRVIADNSTCHKSCKIIDALKSRLLEQKAADRSNISGGVDSVQLVCMNLRRESRVTVLGTFLITGTYKQSDHNETLPIVYYIQAKQRSLASDLGLTTESGWYSLGQRANRKFSLRSMIPGVQYKFRVIAVHSSGAIGRFVESDWIRALPENAKIQAPFNVHTLHTHFSQRGLQTLVRWTADISYPSCFYHLVWMNEEKSTSRTFPVDERMGYIISGLSFDSNYTVKIRSVSDLTVPRLESFAVSTTFRSPSCLKVHNYDFSLCGPDAVQNITVKQSNDTVAVKWEAPKFTTPWNPVALYVINYRNLAHLGDCPQPVEVMYEVSPKTTVHTETLTDGCFYQLSVAAVSMNGRIGIKRVVQFNYTSTYSNITERYRIRMGISPFHPAYLLIVVAGVILIVSVVIAVYIRLKKNAMDIRKHPLTAQLSSLVGKALYRNSLYSNAQISPICPTATTSLPTSTSVSNSCAMAPQALAPCTAASHSAASAVVAASRIERSLSARIPYVDSTDSGTVSTGSIASSESSLAYRDWQMSSNSLQSLSTYRKASLHTTRYSVRVGSTPKPWNLFRFVHIEKFLGEGTFGSIYKARCTAPGIPPTVAVKMTRERNDREAAEHFQREVKILEAIGFHPHIVRFYGVCRQPEAILLEYCAEGNLRDFLRIHRNRLMSFVDREEYFSNEVLLSGSRLLSYSRQIALGMAYLAEKKFIHRDLAARNVLVCEGSEIVKISDFGLSTRQEHYQPATGGQMPLKWMAPEAISQRIFSQHSDVWSFGVTLWEIVTLGSDPYLDVSFADLLTLFKNGERLAKPEHCSQMLYDLMQDCWAELPNARPVFSVIARRLERMLESGQDYMKLDSSLHAIYYQNITQVIERF